ncbi:hypothetical protein MTO96_041526 [Rhipicephalus appendiculatus]
MRDGCPYGEGEQQLRLEPGDEYDQDRVRNGGGHDDTASALSISSFGGRKCIEVHGEDITPEEAEGWSVSGKPIKQIMAGKENGGSAAITRQSRPKIRASFAKRVAASVTKAAEMPIDIPKEDTKVVMGPRGGLNVARTEASIIITLDERRATLYSKAKALNIGDKTYEVGAYRTAPDGTVKGVIRGIAVDDTPEEIAENIVNTYNPLAVEAHRIGNTTTVIVLFARQKVPNYVKYGSILVRCGLFGKHFDVCKQCGKVVVPLEGQGNTGTRKHRITDWDAFRKALPAVQRDITDIEQWAANIVETTE